MIEYTRNCTTCGELIYFIKNSEGRFVPMNAKDKRPHFETCTNPPDNTLPKMAKPSLPKSKISYKSSQKCKKLGEFK